MAQKFRCLFHLSPSHLLPVLNNSKQRRCLRKPSEFLNMKTKPRWFALFETKSAHEFVAQKQWKFSFWRKRHFLHINSEISQWIIFSAEKQRATIFWEITLFLWRMRRFLPKDNFHCFSGQIKRIVLEIYVACFTFQGFICLYKS